MRKTIMFDSKPLTDGEAAALKGKHLTKEHVEDVLSGEDADVFKEDGSPLFLLRTGRIPSEVCNRCRPALRKAAKTSNRRYGALSGTIGFYDPSRFEHDCSKTAFTRDEPEAWLTVLQLLRGMSTVYETAAPAEYKTQMRFYDETNPDFRIPGTAFTTGTVNRNFSFPVHRDKGNLKFGLGVITVLREGWFSGCLLAFPQYRVGVDLQEGDVLLCDNNQWHGNTPFEGVEGDYERISVVAYYRSKLLDV